MAGFRKRTYGNSFSGASTSRKRSKAPVRKKQSRSNRAVRRVYRKAKSAPRTRTARNKSAIYTLGRQVKTLQNQRMGPVQSHIIRGTFPNAAFPGTEMTSFNNLAPWCFQLNDFLTPKNMFYGMTSSSGLPTSEPDPGFGLQGTLVPQIYDTGLADGAEWNARRNLATASKHSYKPLYSRVKITVNMTLPDAWTPKRMRVTLLKVLPIANTFQVTHALPYALGAYRNLAEDPASANANFFWRGKYHQIISDQVKTIRNNLDTEKRQFSFNTRYKYPDSYVVSPHITNIPGGQTVYSNTKISNQIWCLISVESGFSSAIQDVKIMQADSWRDTQGHSDTVALMNEMAELHDQYLHPEEEPEPVFNP